LTKDLGLEVRLKESNTVSEEPCESRVFFYSEKCFCNMILNDQKPVVPKNGIFDVGKINLRRHKLRLQVLIKRYEFLIN